MKKLSFATLVALSLSGCAILEPLTQSPNQTTPDYTHENCDIYDNCPDAETAAKAAEAAARDAAEASENPQ